MTRNRLRLDLSLGFSSYFSTLSLVIHLSTHSRTDPHPSPNWQTQTFSTVSEVRRVEETCCSWRDTLFRSNSLFYEVLVYTWRGASVRPPTLQDGLKLPQCEVNNYLWHLVPVTETVKGPPRWDRLLGRSDTFRWNVTNRDSNDETETSLWFYSTSWTDPV